MKHVPEQINAIMEKPDADNGDNEVNNSSEEDEDVSDDGNQSGEEELEAGDDMVEDEADYNDEEESENDGNSEDGDDMVDEQAEAVDSDEADSDNEDQEDASGVSEAEDAEDSDDEAPECTSISTTRSKASDDDKMKTSEIKLLKDKVKEVRKKRQEKNKDQQEKKRKRLDELNDMRLDPALLEAVAAEKPELIKSKKKKSHITFSTEKSVEENVDQKDDVDDIVDNLMDDVNVGKNDEGFVSLKKKGKKTRPKKRKKNDNKPEIYKMKKQPMKKLKKGIQIRSLESKERCQDPLILAALKFKKKKLSIKKTERMTGQMLKSMNLKQKAKENR